MEAKIQEAINALAAKITGDIKACDALQFTQAALNLAHTAQVLEQTKK